MSRDFLSNFEPIKKQPEEPAQDRPIQYVDSEAEFADHETIRNISFVWPDGRWEFFSYNRLDSGAVNDDHDTIKLYFWSDTVELVGIRLLPLLQSFIDHRRKFVYCDDPRYNHLEDAEPIVNQIVVTRK